MANNKRKFVVSLEIDSKSAEQQIKASAKNISAILENMNKSGDSMTYFKELVGYISKLDAEMSALKKKHGADTFNKMFGSLDTNLQKQMQNLFGTTKEQLTQIEVLRARISKAQSNKNLSMDEAKTIEQDVRALYAAMGKKSDMPLSAAKKPQNVLVHVEKSLDKFVMKWEGVNDRISKGFDFGVSSDSGLGVFTQEIQQEVDKIQNEINELETLKKQHDDIMSKWDQSRSQKGLFDTDNFAPETSIDGVRKLIREFDALEQEINSAEAGSDKYYRTLNKLADVSLKLSNSKKAIMKDEALKQEFKNAPSSNPNLGINELGVLTSYSGTQPDRVFKEASKSTKQIDKIIQAKQKELEVVKQGNSVRSQESSTDADYGKIADDIKQASSEYDTLIQKIKEYKSVVEQITDESTDDSKLKDLDGDAQDLEMQIADLSKLGDKAEEVIGILQAVDIDKIDSNETLSKLCDILGIEIPQSAEKAESALKELDSASEKSGTNAADFNKVENALEDVEAQAKQTAKAIDKVGNSSVSKPKGIDDQNIYTKGQVPDMDSSAEIQQLERLEAKVKEVIAAIEAKTTAFKTEESTVSGVVQSEIADLEKLISKLKEVENKIDLIKSALKSVDTAVDSVSATTQDAKKKVDTDANMANKSSAIGKDYALDATLKATNTILKSILTAVNSNESDGDIAKALDGAITELKAAADAIKINANDFKKKAKDEAKQKSDDSKKDATKGINKEKASEDTGKKVLMGQINSAKKEAADAMKDVKTTIDPTKDLEGYNKQIAKQEEIAQGFKEIEIASEACTNQVKNNQNVEIAALNKKKQELLDNVHAYKKQYDLLNSGGKSGKNYGNTAVIQETTRYNQFKQYANDDAAGFKSSDTFNNKLAQYTAAYNKLIDVRNKLASKTVLTDRDVQEFNDAKKAAANYGKELDKMIAKTQKLEANQFKSSAIGSDVKVDDALSRKQALTDFVTGMHDARESTIKFSNDYQECMFKMKNSDGTWTKMTATLDKVSNKMYSTAGEVTKHGTALGEFAGALKGEFLKLGRYMIASFGIQEVIQVVRTGITYIKEIDDALTDLKKVTNETDAGYDRFLQTMSKTAGIVGSTVAELTTMAAEWARLGYNMQEAANLAESTAILLNVSEFEDATQASEALISTIQAFDYAAEDSMHVVDILNEVGFCEPRLYSNM